MLNGHVYRKNRQHPNGGRCPCMECNDSGRHENAEHFILHCPLYDAVRNRHGQSLRAAWSSLVSAGGALEESWQWGTVMSNPVPAAWFLLGGELTAQKHPISGVASRGNRRTAGRDRSQSTMAELAASHGQVHCGLPCSAGDIREHVASKCSEHGCD